MTSIQLPYGRGHLCFNLPEERLAGIIESRLDTYVPQGTPEELVARSMEEPIGTPRLEELAKGKENVVLLCSDHTRPVPSRAIVPQMLAAIRRGNPQAQITLLIATGCHRGTTPQELEEKFGPEIAAREKIVVHDCADDANMVHLGTLPSGGQLYINRLAAQADLLVAEGFIEPHFFAGFSGGRKSILPGICSERTVNENHSYKAVSHPRSNSGMLKDNPIHADMLCAAKAVNVQFIFNVALDGEKKIVAAWAGDLEKAHEAGVAFIRQWSQCPVVTGDIVVTSNGGYPLDQNLYQSPKAMATAEACAGEDGVIIMCCSCCDGMGGAHFGQLIQRGTPDEIDRYLSSIPPEKTIPEQWCTQVCVRVLRKHPVILVTTFLSHDEVRKANMIPASTPDEALEIAYRLKGEQASVVVIPDGVSVLTVKE